MGANVEPSHARESLWVEYAHFKIDLGYLEPLIDELSGIGLFSYELLGRRFDSEDGAFFKLHQILFLLHELGALFFHKLLHLLFVHIFNLDTFKATSCVESGRNSSLISIDRKICIAQVNAVFHHLLLVLLLLLVERIFLLLVVHA